MLERKRQKKPCIFFFFFRLSLNYVYTDVDNRERARVRGKKQKRRASLKEQRETELICSGGEKMRSATDQQGENERQ